MAIDGPIFVLGITGRCGSTYVLELISLHPDCVEQDRIEDFLLDESDPLFKFRDRMAYRWRWMKDGPELAARIAPAFGDALIGIIAGGRQGRLVTKTPSVKNLDRFFDFFPNASLIILVRDPRSVVASAEGSWNADGEAWARQWARRAQTILDFDARHHDQGQPYTIVRYEDVVMHPRETVTEMMRALDLDPDAYDFDALREMPVRGSSQDAVDGRISWTPVERTSEFSPTNRWESWPAKQLARIEWVAGPGLEAFGYERTAPKRSTVAPDQLVRSGVLWIRLAIRQAVRRVRRSRRIAAASSS